MQAGPKLQVLSLQHTSSTTNVEGAIGSETPKFEVHKDEEVPEVHKEPDRTLGKSETSTQEQM
jgi:hypothetical protein